MSAIESPASSNAAGAALPRAERRRIFLYLGGLIMLVVLNNPNGGLLDVPLTFLRPQSSPPSVQPDRRHDRSPRATAPRRPT